MIFCSEAIRSYSFVLMRLFFGIMILRIKAQYQKKLAVMESLICMRFTVRPEIRISSKTQFTDRALMGFFPGMAVLMVISTTIASKYFPTISAKKSSFFTLELFVLRYFGTGVLA